jgi:hypothetical protein
MTGAVINVKRLAAVDMWGTRGTMRRRRIILAEFITGVIAATAVGAWIAVAASSAGTKAFGIWGLCAGLNYLPLAVHAARLSRPGALDAELADVDVARELRRYSVLQLWILVPLSLVVFSLYGLTRPRAPLGGGRRHDAGADGAPARYDGGDQAGQSG